MTNDRKADIEELARYKANNLVFGDSIHSVAEDLMNAQITLLPPCEEPSEEEKERMWMEEMQWEEDHPDPEKITPPGSPEEKELYYRAMIVRLADEAKQARAAVLDVGKYLFNLEPKDCAEFFLNRADGAFGQIPYSAITDAVRELSKLPTAAEIRRQGEAFLKELKARPRRKKYPKGYLTQALMIINCGLERNVVHVKDEITGEIKVSGHTSICAKTLRRWLDGEHTPPSFPGIDDLEKLGGWALKFDYRSFKRARTEKLFDER
ncbi:MAG: hypothetical protein IJU70_10610 [Lentisphaeria bacterium]|nr:hypothetical protein [Lentisphaeria bacterium]